MKNEEKFHYALRVVFVSAFCILHPALISLCHAEEFGDISVSAEAMYSGNTFHGYAETRVVLENHSPDRAHRVALIYPNNVWGNYGNCINRVSRSVTLAPGARAAVALFQPPLPVNGDGSIRVEVDNRDEGGVRAPNANNHCNYYSRSGQAATVFISRSLDFDAVGHVLNAGRAAFTAAMATGAPDAGHGGLQPNTWMPDQRRYGQTNWLELDYATPQTINKISVHSSQPLMPSGFIALKGISGTNLVRLPLSAGRSTGSGWVTEFSFPTTREPAKTVRLDFERTSPYNISVDAVQISGPSGSQWAADARASSYNSSSGSYPRGSIEGLRAETPAAEWSQNWLAYTPFDAVALTEHDLNSAPPVTVAALWNYLQAGGNVFVFGNSGFPDTWRSAVSKPLPDGTEYDEGLGRCFVFAPEDPSKLDPKTVQTLRETVRSAAYYWQSLPRDSGAANAALPVVKSLKIPTRGIVLIMLLFIIVIGPVNLIVLNRRKRRTWMLWTIPAISFATTLLVFAYSLLREGVTPDALITGLTVLNQADHHAATVGAEAFYCPLTPSGGLHFDSTTEATPLVPVGSGSGTAREVDWTQSQHLSHGWVSARIPAYFHVRESKTRRERLQIERENGHWQVVNGLGAPVQSLWFADANGKIYQANRVTAGGKIFLRASNAKISEQLGAPGLDHDLGFTLTRAGELSASVDKYLLPDTYIAVLNGNPFLENALGSAASPKRTRSSAVVFGILERTESK